MTILSTPRRPWDKERDGFIVGEGPGFWYSKNWSAQKRRGAPIMAEMVGYGMSADAHHITSPPEDGEGGYRVMRNALQRRAASSLPQSSM